MSDITLPKYFCKNFAGGGYHLKTEMFYNVFIEEKKKGRVKMTEEKSKPIENLLNDLIAEAVKRGGHVYVVDKAHNTFALRLTEPIKIQFYGGYKGESDNGGKQ